MAALPLRSRATNDPDDDHRVVALAQQGNRASLETVVSRHHPEVSRLLWRFTRRPADHADLVQDVFLRVVRNLPDWQPDQPFLHWLRRITVNVGRDFCRREATRRRWLDQPDDTTAEAIAPGADPAAHAAAAEAKAVLAHLSPDDRTLLTLHYLEGWDFAQIGELLGWSRPVTKLRAFRARRRLRTLLAEKNFP